MTGQRTFLQNPVFRGILWSVSVVFLKLTGWKVAGERPEPLKYVLIAAPHTTNWDFPVALAICFALRINIYWMAKDTLFRPPFGWIMRRLGGIPVDRRKGHLAAKHVMDAFRNNDRLVVVIPPEGTRSKVTKWKTGFYRIANDAHVPLVCGFLDYSKKLGGFGRTIVPTGNMEDDFVVIRDFYINVVAKYPEKTDYTSLSKPNQTPTERS